MASEYPQIEIDHYRPHFYPIQTGKWVVRLWGHPSSHLGWVNQSGLLVTDDTEEIRHATREDAELAAMRYLLSSD